MKPLQGGETPTEHPHPTAKGQSWALGYPWSPRASPSGFPARTQTLCGTT